jgi:hypothetical protein
MNDENQELRNKSVVVHGHPHSIDEILRFVYPAPDGETERFVAAIYADRRASVAAPSNGPARSR